MTQSGLAEAVGVTKNTVSEWERGRPPRELAKLSKLADVLRVDAQWLLHGPAPENLIYVPRTTNLHAVRESERSLSTGDVTGAPRVLAWLYRFRADLIELGATEDQAENASDVLKQIVRSPAVGGAHHDWTEDEAIVAMEPEAEDIRKTFTKLNRR